MNYCEKLRLRKPNDRKDQPLKHEQYLESLEDLYTDQVMFTVDSEDEIEDVVGATDEEDYDGNQVAHGYYLESFLAQLVLENFDHKQDQCANNHQKGNSERR